MKDVEVVTNTLNEMIRDIDAKGGYYMVNELPFHFTVYGSDRAIIRKTYLTNMKQLCVNALAFGIDEKFEYNTDTQMCYCSKGNMVIGRSVAGKRMFYGKIGEEECVRDVFRLIKHFFLNHRIRHDMNILKEYNKGGC